MSYSDTRSEAGMLMIPITKHVQIAASDRIKRYRHLPEPVRFLFTKLLTDHSFGRNFTLKDGSIHEPDPARAYPDGADGELAIRGVTSADLDRLTANMSARGHEVSENHVNEAWNKAHGFATTHLPRTT